MDIMKIKKMDKEASLIKEEISMLEWTLNKLKEENAEYIQKSKEIMNKIRALESRINEIKEQMDAEYGPQAQSPIPGARHEFRMINSILVEDIRKIPIEFKQVNIPAARDAIKNGIKIPGIKVISKRIIAIR